MFYKNFSKIRCSEKLYFQAAPAPSPYQPRREPVVQTYGQVADTVKPADSYAAATKAPTKTVNICQSVKYLVVRTSCCAQQSINGFGVKQAFGITPATCYKKCVALSRATKYKRCFSQCYQTTRSVAKSLINAVCVCASIWLLLMHNVWMLPVLMFRTRTVCTSVNV